MQVAVCIKNGVALPKDFNNFGAKVAADESHFKAKAKDFVREAEALEKAAEDEAILALELFVVDFKNTKAGHGPWLAPDGTRLKRVEAHEAMRLAAKRKFDSLIPSERDRYVDAAQEMAALDEDHDLSDNIELVMRKSTPSWYTVKENMIHESIRAEIELEQARKNLVL